MATLSMRIAPSFGKDIVDMARVEAYEQRGWDRAIRILSESFGEEILPYVDSILTGKQTMSLADPQGNMDLEADSWKAPWDYKLKKLEIEVYLSILKSYYNDTNYKYIYEQSWNAYGSAIQDQLYIGLNPFIVKQYNLLREFILGINQDVANFLAGATARNIGQDTWFLSTSEEVAAEIDIENFKSMKREDKALRELLALGSVLMANRNEKVSAIRDNEFSKNQSSGFVSPSGDFYPCKAYQHGQLAQELGYDENTLVDTGWIRVQEKKWIITPEELTKRQLNTLIDYSNKFNECKGVLFEYCTKLVSIDSIIEAWEKEHKQ